MLNSTSRERGSGVGTLVLACSVATAVERVLLAVGTAKLRFRQPPCCCDYSSSCVGRFAVVVVPYDSVLLYLRRLQYDPLTSVGEMKKSAGSAVGISSAGHQRAAYVELRQISCLGRPIK